jgi:hypothetical protein
MPTAMGVVEGGRVRLLDDVELPEGQPVVVEWEEEQVPPRPFLEREPLAEEDVQHDIEWARRWRWDRGSS